MVKHISFGKKALIIGMVALCSVTLHAGQAQAVEPFKMMPPLELKTQEINFRTLAPLQLEQKVAELTEKDKEDTGLNADPFLPPRECRFGSISPDGSKIGFYLWGNTTSSLPIFWNEGNVGVIVEDRMLGYTLLYEYPELKGDFRYMPYGGIAGFWPKISVGDNLVAFSTIEDGVNNVYVADLQLKTLSFIPTSRAGDGNPSLSGGKRGVFMSTRDGNHEVYFFDLEHKVLANVSLSERSDDYDPVISSDGNSVAFVSDRDGNAEIYVANLRDKTLVNISNNKGIDREPSISYDGKRIAFTSGREKSYAVYLADLERKTLTLIPGWNSPSISGDGDRIAVAEHDDISLVDLKKSRLIHVTNDGASGSNAGYDLDPVISYDGTRILYQTDGNFQCDIASIPLE